MIQATQAVSTALFRPAHRLGRTIRLAAACLFALASTPALAEDTTTECDTSLGQNGLTACAARLAEQADADMAVAFAKAKKAMQAIDMNVSEIRPNPAGAVEALERSQRGWLEYREGRCIIEGFAERGGSMELMVVSECEEEMTRIRIAELNAWAED